MERTAFGCCVIDDLIGTESRVSMTTSDLDELYEAKPLKNRTGTRSRSSAVTTRQYPPPMNQNPWNLEREYCDGRLIVKVERVKRRQHFEVRRENGRVVMTIVVSEEEEHKVEVKEEGRDVTYDELANERSSFSVDSYDGYMEMGLKVSMVASLVVRDPPPSRPITTAM